MMRAAQQAFVEHIATLPRGAYSSPLFSRFWSRTRLIHTLRLRMKSFFEDQTQRARKRRSTSFWIGWRIRSAVVSKALTDYLAAAGKQT